MIDDIVDLAPSSLVADVCIVGGGAAGLTIAQALAGTPVSVVLLESGRRSFDERTQQLYRSHVVGLAHGGIHRYRFRQLGGSTTRWAGQVAPFFDIDFERRAWVSRSGWPLQRDELEPFYRRAAELLAVPPFSPVPVGAWPKALPPPPAWDPRLVAPYFSAFTARPNLAETLGPGLAAAPRVRIVLGANVTELVTDPAATAVERVLARSLDGRTIEVRARFVVVCCGGIETARILLASDRHSEGGIGNGAGLVGRFFLDHPGFAVAPVRPRDPGAVRDAFEPRKEGGVKFAPRFRAADDLQRRERLLHTGGACLFDFSESPSVKAGRLVLRALRRPELRAQVPRALSTIALRPLPLAAAVLRVARARPALDVSGPPMLVVGCEQVPNPDSRVYLAADEDAVGMRRVVLEWRLTEHEIASCRRFAEVASAELERGGLGTVDLESFVLPDDPGELSGLVVDAGHHMGTTRMAAAPAEGVVDPECRVFGVENLYVGSCSVFPTAGLSNPTFTMIALCLRLAEELRRRTRGGANA